MRVEKLGNTGMQFQPLRCIQYGRVDISRVGLAFLDFEVGRHSGLQTATRSPAAAADRRRCAGR